MKIFDVESAKSQLSHLFERVCAGEYIVIAREGEPVVRLVPVDSPAPRRQRGSLEGQVIVPDSFFDPLPPEELDA